MALVVISVTGLVRKDFHKALKALDLRAGLYLKMRNLSCNKESPIRLQSGLVGSVFIFYCLKFATLQVRTPTTPLPKLFATNGGCANRFSDGPAHFAPFQIYIVSISIH